MNREIHVRLRESLRVRLPWATRPITRRSLDGKAARGIYGNTLSGGRTKRYRFDVSERDLLRSSIA